MRSTKPIAMALLWFVAASSAAFFGSARCQANTGSAKTRSQLSVGGHH
jgi:hypothetical protein